MALTLPSNPFPEFRALLKNAWGGIKLSLMVPVRPSQFYISWSAVWTALYFVIAIVVCANYFAVPLPRMFDPWQLTRFAGLLGVLFFTCFGAARLFHDQSRVVATVVIYLNATLLPTVLYEILYSNKYLETLVQSGQPNFRIAFLAWQFFICYRVIAAAFPHFFGRRVVAAIALLSNCYFSPSPVQLPFWQHFPDHDNFAGGRPNGPPLSEEAVLQHQHVILDEKLEALNFSPSQNPRLFAIVMGNDGHQHVFLREAQFVGKTLTNLYGLKGQLLELINSDETTDEYPLATATNLEDSLHYIGAHMSKKDILVLYMTSHGGHDSGIVVQMNGFYGMRYITGEMLDDMFSDAGIQNRIIIVAACYSGQIIDSLKTPNSLVITAADKDHTSFGCADDADLTEFGRAYFQDALPKTGNFITAFDAAKAIIIKREAELKITPSNPQIFIGEKIKPIIEGIKRTRPQ